MSSAMDYVNRYIPDVSKRGKLCEEVADADIPELALDMTRWEEEMAGPLELTPREIEDIHEETNKPKLKRQKVLQLWKAKINARPDGVWATYGMLLEKCLQGRDIKTAENICKLIQRGDTGGGYGGQFQPQQGQSRGGSEGSPAGAEQTNPGVTKGSSNGNSSDQKPHPPVAMGSSDTATLLSIVLASPTAGYHPVEHDGGGRAVQYEAQDRGTNEAELKLHDKDGRLTKIAPKSVLQEHSISGYYSMRSKLHGIALIINNKNFTDHPVREGTERDEYNLIQTCMFLGYRSVIFRDLTSDQILDLFSNLDKYLKGSDNICKIRVAHDSFMCCILSHGARGVVFGSDSKSVTREDIERGTGKSKTLEGKPKIFFIQACQGDGAGTAPVSTIRPDGGLFSKRPTTSERAHMYTCLASVIGDRAYRCRDKGSWFVTEVCKILCEYGTCFKFPDDFMPRLNRNVTTNNSYRYWDEVERKYCVQQPEGATTLQHCIHFFGS